METPALLQPLLLLLLLALAPALAQDCSAPCDVSRCPRSRCPGGYTPDPCKCCLVCAAQEGEPCGRPSDSPCGESLECRRGSCRCRWAQPVCGNDGSTYATLCALLAANRRAIAQSLLPVRQLHKGACQPPGKPKPQGRRAGLGLAGGPGRRAQAGCRAQGSGPKAQSTGLRAQGSEHRV